MEEEKKTTQKKSTKRATKSKVNSRMLDVLEKIEKAEEKAEKKEVKESNTAKNKINENKTTKTKANTANKSTKKSIKEKTIENKQVARKTNTDYKVTKEENKQKTKRYNAKLDLSKVEEEIEKQTKIPKEKKKVIYGRVFENIAIALGIMIYFIFINLGYINIKPQNFVIDLRVFSITSIVITVLIFEYAYKKNSDKYAISGIEVLVFSIVNLFLEAVYNNYQDKFMYIVAIVPVIFAIYYLIKSLIIYIKLRKKALKQASDVYKISKK